MSSAVNSASSVRVVIAGGGTGGHLFPGIAVARELKARRPDALVTFAGTARGLEARVVPREGFELDVIRSAGIKGRSVAQRVRGALLLPASGLDAWRLLSRRRPHLVIGVGGYSSGPVVAAAALRGIPTMLLEQNAVPGLTNRLLARVVRAAAVSYEATVPHFGANAFVSGNPVRPEFFSSAEAPTGPPPRAARILIFGGSQGAHAINLAMVEAAPHLAARAGELSITHQTGEHDFELVVAAYARSGLGARVEPFLYQMDREMKHADVIVCRAGATTLAELAAAGRAAILVPLPTATDDHQRTNAAVLGQAGAVEVIDQQALTGVLLAERLMTLVGATERRERMTQAIRRFARPDAARVIVDHALAMTGRAG